MNDLCRPRRSTQSRVGLSHRSVGLKDARPPSMDQMLRLLEGCGALDDRRNLMGRGPPALWSERGKEAGPRSSLGVLGPRRADRARSSAAQIACPRLWVARAGPDTAPARILR